MKFGLLIEYNMRNIFLNNSYTKCGAETTPRPFSKKIKIEHLSRSIAQSFMQIFFIACQIEDYRSILKLSCRPLAFTSHKACLKNKEV